MGIILLTRVIYKHVGIFLVVTRIGSYYWLLLGRYQGG